MQHRIWTSFLLPAVALCVMSWPAAAHHAFGSEFDSDRPVILKGKIVKIEWINPHTWIHVEITTHCSAAAPTRTPSRKERKWSLTAIKRATIPNCVPTRAT